LIGSVFHPDFKYIVSRLELSSATGCFGDQLTFAFMPEFNLGALRNP
jgi:hypothetical protein